MSDREKVGYVTPIDYGILETHNGPEVATPIAMTVDALIRALIEDGCDVDSLEVVLSPEKIDVDGVPRDALVVKAMGERDRVEVEQ